MVMILTVCCWILFANILFGNKMIFIRLVCSFLLLHLCSDNNINAYFIKTSEAFLLLPQHKELKQHLNNLVLKGFENLNCESLTIPSVTKDVEQLTAVPAHRTMLPPFSKICLAVADWPNHSFSIDLPKRNENMSIKRHVQGWLIAALLKRAQHCKITCPSVEKCL